MKTYGNPILRQLPDHLKQYIVDQNYERYTPIDQSVWRYVMRQNYHYLKNIAYYPYIPGLKKAGISIERIPDLQEMNDHLKEIGWGAATVDGFIPPVAFMEFQAYHVLVIAADIRQLEHIAYTPTPDIIHESSGHAPIIAEQAYADYLHYFGKIGAKAMFSFKDFQLYEAIRKLSILKETVNVSAFKIAEAEEELNIILENMGEPSEMALLSRLHWWTVEYGLIGTLEDPKIYGAGLLSSIGESASCMQPNVKKIPYTLDAINYPYDITKPQPQLFVTANFDQLLDVLNEFADTMAFKVGGKTSIDKAIECKNVCTAVYSSGLQVSGKFIETSKERELTYIKTEGPTALSIGDKQLNGHGKESHANGFGSPVGSLKDALMPLEEFTDEFLGRFNILVDQYTDLHFKFGIEVKGKVKSIKRKKDKIILISFTDCTVINGATGKTYFEPQDGIYDMAVGERIISVYCGAADKNAYVQIPHKTETHIQIPIYTEKTVQLHKLYQTVRTIRESGKELERLPAIWDLITKTYPDEWLCPLEILELLYKYQSYTGTAGAIKNYLHNQANKNPQLSKLIFDGLNIIR
ncbi:MAG TPA: aromatic amino acid hydroxylase [Pseudosphingobacterium sp.]|nr:aromatic amino acid hydroxylase [Pseudosphingobacterium sp.]